MTTADDVTEEVARQAAPALEQFAEHFRRIAELKEALVLFADALDAEEARERSDVVAPAPAPPEEAVCDLVVRDDGMICGREPVARFEGSLPQVVTFERPGEVGWRCARHVPVAPASAPPPQRVDALEERFKRIEAVVAGLAERIDGLMAAQNRTASRVEALERVRDQTVARVTALEGRGWSWLPASVPRPRHAWLQGRAE